MSGSTNFPGSLDSHTGASPLGFGEVVNQAYTLATAAHTNSVTTLTVASTSVFPSKGYLIVKRELISYTGKTSTTFTGCTRGVGGTTAAAFLSGTLVEQVVTAANHNDLAAALVAVETVLGAGITSSYGVMRKIAEVSGTGASGVLEFSSIPAVYRHLQIEFWGRSDNASIGVTVQLTAETSPTAGAYNHVVINAGNSAVTVPENVGTSDFVQAGFIPAASSTANLIAGSTIRIAEYANTSVFKPVLVFGNSIFDLSAGNLFIKNSAGIIELTAAIDRVRLTLSAGNWTTTSRATLYGLPT